MAAFSPLAFAVANASTTDNGLLFIETANGGTGSRYNAELSDLGEDVVQVLSNHDVVFVTDLTFAEANAKLAKIAAEHSEGSCLSFAALFLKPNGHILCSWNGGQEGPYMMHAQLAIHGQLDDAA